MKDDDERCIYKDRCARCGRSFDEHMNHKSLPTRTRLEKISGYSKNLSTCLTSEGYTISGKFVLGIAETTYWRQKLGYPDYFSDNKEIQEYVAKAKRRIEGE